jgi:hypothetical protein
MITPITNYKKCYNFLTAFQNNGGGYGDLASTWIANVFKENPAWANVYRNFNFDIPYEAWVYEGVVADKALGYKYLQSYPYEQIAFSQGDYISWDYGNELNSVWILESLDKRFTYDVRGRMWKCNQVAKYKNKDGTIDEVFVSFQNSLNYTNFKYNSTGLTIPSGTIVLLAQQNEKTTKWLKNTRFIFGKAAWKVNQILTEVNSNFMEIYLSEDGILDTDDIANGVAFNNNTDEPNPNITQTLIEPEVYDILKGQPQTFTVKAYVNGVQNQDTFAVTASGVDTKKYTLVQDSGNSFVVASLEENASPLVISCLNNSTNDIVSISIYLKGEW